MLYSVHVSFLATVSPSRLSGYFRYAMPESDFSLVVPAQLAFLTIYNPLLGPTDETITDQIVFYTSKSTLSRWNGTSSIDVDVEESRDEWNQRLRQIGLSQGMVNFARYAVIHPHPIMHILTDTSETSPMDSLSILWRQTRHALSFMSWRKIGGS